ncbi:hypothetical protein [Nostoc sp. FACHB-892]|uniref:hypothetical protein n=1 Tax=Nostoc sp. FACHB-892 TaxID=2692843 RepID=UPI00168336B3|nr:hypothetical protein [Nostoc sp. FACHB-892]
MTKVMVLFANSRKIFSKKIDYSGNEQAVSEAAIPGVGSDWISTARIKNLEERFLKRKSSNRSQPPFLSSLRFCG